MEEFQSDSRGGGGGGEFVGVSNRILEWLKNGLGGFLGAMLSGACVLGDWCVFGGGKGSQRGRSLGVERGKC